LQGALVFTCGKESAVGQAMVRFCLVPLVGTVVVASAEGVGRKVVHVAALRGDGLGVV